jgi:hypothetical protein
MSAPRACTAAMCGRCPKRLLLSLVMVDPIAGKIAFVAKGIDADMLLKMQVPTRIAQAFDPPHWPTTAGYLD